MGTLTPEALEAWENRERRTVLTTVDANGAPDTVWILCVERYGDEGVVIANNSMSKTLANIENGCAGSLLYIAPERESYQVKGRIENHTEGPVFDDMKRWLDPKYPGRSAILLRSDEVWYGSKRVV